jgi:hypothetical protein
VQQEKTRENLVRLILSLDDETCSKPLDRDVPESFRILMVAEVFTSIDYKLQLIVGVRYIKLVAFLLEFQIHLVEINA